MDGHDGPEIEIGAFAEVTAAQGTDSGEEQLLEAPPSTETGTFLAPRNYRELADLRMLQLMKLHSNLDDDPRFRLDPDQPPAIRCAQLLAKLTGESLDFCVNVLQGKFSVGMGQVSKWLEKFCKEPWAVDFNWRFFGPLEAPPVEKLPQPELLPVFVIISEGSGQVEIRLPPGYVALGEQCSARIAGENNDVAFIQIKVRKE